MLQVNLQQKKENKMKSLFVLPLVAVMLVGTGCSQIQNNPQDAEKLSLAVERVTELSARLAFTQQKVVEKKQQICDGVAVASAALISLNDPNATLDTLKTVASAAIDKIPETSLPANTKGIVKLIVVAGLDASESYVKEAYSTLLAKPESQVVLKTAQAAAKGLSNACQ